MNTSVKFYIYPETRGNSQTNDKIKLSDNLMFDAIISQELFRWR
jgi:hypothetical protein